LFYGGQRSSRLLHEISRADLVKRDSSSKKVLGIEASENEIGVGYGREFAASVADGARISSGRFRAYMEDSSLIERG
jgi:hypothetical protein